MDKRKKHSIHYIFAFAITLIGILLHLVLNKHYQLLPFVLANPMIFTFAYFWGFGPAFLSSLVWSVTLSFLYFEPVYSFKIMNTEELVQLILFLFLTNIVSYLVDKGRKNEQIQREVIRENAAAEMISQTRNEDLIRENKLKDQFVSTLSHDLRNPLAVTRLGLDLILRKPAETEHVKKMALKGLANIDRIDKMISDLLDSRRISAGNPLNLTFEKFTLVPLLKKVIEDFELIHGDRFILVNEEEIEVNWCQSYIRRALENLIGNALKYGYQDTLVEIGFSKVSEKELDLWVRNQGKVLSDVEINKMFVPFSRIHDGEKEGWGIGLTLIKAIVEGHKGRLEVTSFEKVGTTFHMILPINFFH